MRSWTSPSIFEVGVPVRRLTAPVPDSALRRWERAFLLVVTTSILVVGLMFLSGQGLLSAPSPFLWPVLGLAVGVIGAVLWQGFQLFVRREHRPDTLGRGLATLPALSATALLVAGAGTVTELWTLAATLEAGVPDPAPLLTSGTASAPSSSAGLMTCTYVDDAGAAVTLAGPIDALPARTTG